MEFHLNKEECTETCIFINFSIREYVAEIRKKNPVKCWPFGSLYDPDNKVVSLYQSSEATFLSGQNCISKINCSDDTPKLTEAPNLSKVENFNGKEDRPKTTIGVDRNMEKVICNGASELTFCKFDNGQTQHENNVDEDAKTRHNNLGVDRHMEKVVGIGSSDLTFCKVNNGQTRHENNVDEDAKIRRNEAADNNEPQRNRPRRKHHKFRLLFDIYKDPASELRASCDRTNPENVNKRFVAEVEDDSDDDVTLAAYFRKQKGVEITYSTLNKKRDAVAVEEPSVDQDKKSNHGSKDSIEKVSRVGTSRKRSRTDDIGTQTMVQHEKDFRLQCNRKINQFAEVSCKEATEKEKENEDSEMAAVMLLARHFNEQKQILGELKTNTTCVCIKKKIREHSTQSGNKRVAKTSSKTATKHPVKKITKENLENSFPSVQRMCFMPVKATTDGGFQSHVEMSMTKAAGVVPDAQNCATLVCSFNRNPADFSIPNDENKFMR